MTTKRPIPVGLIIGVVMAAAGAPMKLWGLVAVGVCVAVFSAWRNYGGMKQA